MIKTLLFDLGNVVLYFSHEQMCAQLGAMCGRSGDDVRRWMFDEGILLELERGTLSDEDFHRLFQERFAARVPLEALRLAGSDIFRLNAPMPALLDALKAAGYRLVLLSNTCVAHVEFVRSNFDVLERFDRLVLSCEVGAVKPEPAIFAAALSQIGCAPDECFYTDDIAAYVAAGRRIGLQAEVFTTFESLIEQLAQRGVRVGM